MLCNLSAWILYVADLGSTEMVFAHPMAFAGWVGLLITGLNLIPIGQLDGGHILYALLRKKAHLVTSFLFFVGVITYIFGLHSWILMLGLLWIMGTRHPPTSDDEMPLGRGRILLGWLTLAFIFIGFTPIPFTGH